MKSLLFRQEPRGEGIVTFDTRVPRSAFVNFLPISGSPLRCPVYTPVGAVSRFTSLLPWRFTRATYLTRLEPFWYVVVPLTKDCRVSDFATATCIHRSDRVGKRVCLTVAPARFLFSILSTHEGTCEFLVKVLWNLPSQPEQLNFQLLGLGPSESRRTPKGATDWPL